MVRVGPIIFRLVLAFQTKSLRRLCAILSVSVTNENKMPDSSSCPSTAVTSAPTMSDKNKAESNKRNNDVLIDLGDITPHNIKVLKKVNQVI